MVEAEYTVLATNLLDYFNKFSSKRFVPHSLLLCARSVPDFLAAAQTPPPHPPLHSIKATAFSFYTSAIWYNPILYLIHHLFINFIPVIVWVQKQNTKQT